ncbi:MAG: SMI1/KNR4 family protein [Chthoniobacteraceae bacterium]
MNLNLPLEYISYIETDGISEGLTDGMPGYFILWHPDEIESNNTSLKIQTYAPGFLGFGSDGGGELLAFDASGAVFMLPMIGMAPKYAQKIGNSWKEIEQRIIKNS